MDLRPAREMIQILHSSRGRIRPRPAGPQILPRPVSLTTKSSGAAPAALRAAHTSRSSTCPLAHEALVDARVQHARAPGDRVCGGNLVETRRPGPVSLDDHDSCIGRRQFVEPADAARILRVAGWRARHAHGDYKNQHWLFAAASGKIGKRKRCHFLQSNTLDCKK